MSEFNLKAALAAIAKRRGENPPVPVPTRHIDPNSADERIKRARQLEQHVLDQIDWLRTQPDSDVKTIRLETLYDRLGELAAEQGDFSRAATISHAPVRRKHYQEMAKALKRNDEKNCDCAPDL